MALELEIVTPEKRVATATCDEVRAPGVQGGFGIRPGHTPFVSILEPGRLTVVAGGQEVHYAIGGGFLQVADDRVIVLAETAEAREEIDLERARRAFQESNERLRSLTEQDEHHAMEAARVKRAAARISVAG
ncbi:MAG TPA: F0F1 ATP synthase subunit epsilon [Anaeromyxobacteraceae bacterium]|nr:F0F1 ATP synthase subunit epsilon [Anaeromyxobacteraceae bacterium]